MDYGWGGGIISFPNRLIRLATSEGASSTDSSPWMLSDSEVGALDGIKEEVSS